MLVSFVATLGLLAAAPLPATVPMRLVNNHGIVDVSLDGVGPFRFIVDSGAGNPIDPAVHARIGASVLGHVRLVGVGSEQTGGVTTVGSVRIGTANFADQRFVVAPTRAALSAGEGSSIDGLIGRGIIGSGIPVFGKLGLHSSVSFGAIALKRIVADFSFTPAFDLAHGRIGLRPNDDFDRPARVDRSGIFLVARAAEVAIFDVRQQTPAVRAGLARDGAIPRTVALRPGDYL